MNIFLSIKILINELLSINQIKCQVTKQELALEPNENEKSKKAKKPSKKTDETELEIVGFVYFDCKQWIIDVLHNKQSQNCVSTLPIIDASMYHLCWFACYTLCMTQLKQ